MKIRFLATVTAAAIAAVLLVPAHAQTTQEEIQADLLQSQIQAAMQANDHAAAADLFDQYDALGVAMPPPLQKHRAVVYFRLQRYLDAERELRAYLQLAERGSEDYRQAISMLTEVTPLAEAEEERVRREAEAEEERVRQELARQLERLRAEGAFRDCPECPVMVALPAGSFMMGSPSSEQGRDDDEGPVHRVTMARPFAVGVYEVTRGEYARFVSATGHSPGDSCFTYEGGEWEERSGRNWRRPGFSQTDLDPVVCVNWGDAQAYTRWLSGETGEEYRLLSESEWEYVARAGTRTARYWGESDSGQCRHANGGDQKVKGQYSDWPREVVSCDDGHVHTAPVGSYVGNGYGLHDVLGNVWEWTLDCWNESYQGAPNNGSAWESGECSRRVLRGGSWNYAPRILRSANRLWDTTGDRDIEVGFRVARTLTP